MTPRRFQPLVAIRRRSDGLWYWAPRAAAPPSWTAQLALANVVTPAKAGEIIRRAWGLDEADFEAVPVVPRMVEDA